jgi:hypothetical protein
MAERTRMFQSHQIFTEMRFSKLGDSLVSERNRKIPIPVLTADPHLLVIAHSSNGIKNEWILGVIVHIQFIN